MNARRCDHGLPLAEHETGCESLGHARKPPRPPDNGNTFVFCDHVAYFEDSHGGCVRGAGHDGPHLFAPGDYDPTNGPALLAPFVPHGPNYIYTNEHGDKFRLIVTGDRVVPFVIEPIIVKAGGK
jgi:hypothetical protein